MKVKDLFAALEEKDLSTLKQITASIKTFDKEKSLKRSKTFDRSALTLDLIKIPMSIQHFNTGSLKHVDSVDKSSPMHIYSLLRSDSSYSNYLETPSANVAEDTFESISETDNSFVVTNELLEGSYRKVTAEELIAKDKLSHINQELPESKTSNNPADKYCAEEDIKTETKNVHDEGQYNVHLTRSDDLYTEQSEVDEKSVNGSQSLLSGSYVVLKESAVKENSADCINEMAESMQTIEADFDSHSTTVSTDKVPVLAQTGGSEPADDLQSEIQSISDKSKLNSNIGDLLANYDIPLDVEALPENDLEIPGCSSLTTEETVVIDASQLEKKGDQCNLVSEGNSVVTVCDPLTSSQDIEDIMNSVEWTGSVEKGHTDFSNLPDENTVNIKRPEKGELSYQHEKSGQNVVNESSESNITKVIDDALTDIGTNEQGLNEVSKSGFTIKDRSDLAVLPPYLQESALNDGSAETKDISDIIDDLAVVKMAGSNSLT